jgi:hypothetical protein
MLGPYATRSCIDDDDDGNDNDNDNNNNNEITLKTP